MTRDFRYILFLVIAFTVYVTVRLMSPRELDWTPTYSVVDKDPFGGHVLDKLLRNYFAGQSRHSYRTLYELQDSLEVGMNLIILADSFSPPREDTDVLLAHVADGATAFVAAERFYDHFADTLGISTRDYLMNLDIGTIVQDSTYLTIAGSDSPAYHYKRSHVAQSFQQFDSVTARVFARNEEGLPVAIRIPWGKGQLILSCTPLAFTNHYLLNQNNHTFAAYQLSYLPIRNVYRMEYYQMGRMEANTPLRFVLSRPALRWAYYISLFTLLLFMVFEVRRRQRVIPVIPPLTNTSLEFVGAVGNLYFQRGDHRDVAKKKISFFLDQVRMHYYIDAGQNNEGMIQHLAGKSGRSEAEVRDLWQLMAQVQASDQISAEILMDLSRRIEEFQKSLYS